MLSNLQNRKYSAVSIRNTPTALDSDWCEHGNTWVDREGKKRKKEKTNGNFFKQRSNTAFCKGTSKKHRKQTVTDFASPYNHKQSHSLNFAL